MVYEQMSDSEDHEVQKNQENKSETEHLNNVKYNETEKNETELQLTFKRTARRSENSHCPISSGKESIQTCVDKIDDTRSDDNVNSSGTDKNDHNTDETITTPQKSKCVEDMKTSETETHEENIELSDNRSIGLFEICRNDKK